MKALGIIEKGTIKAISYLKLAPARIKKVAMAAYSGASVIPTATISSANALFKNKINCLISTRYKIRVQQTNRLKDGHHLE